MCLHLELVARRPRSGRDVISGSARSALDLRPQATALPSSLEGASLDMERVIQNIPHPFESLCIACRPVPAARLFIPEAFTS